MKISKILAIVVINVFMEVSSSCLYAQNFVTEVKSTIVEHFDSLQVEYDLAVTTDGFEYLNIIDGQVTVRYYFNASDTCIAYKMWLPKEGFDESVKVLNGAFEKIGDSMWQEYDGRQHFIWSLDTSGSGYTISVFSKRRLDLQKLE